MNGNGNTKKQRTGQVVHLHGRKSTPRTSPRTPVRPTVPFRSDRNTIVRLPRAKRPVFLYAALAGAVFLLVTAALPGLMAKRPVQQQSAPPATVSAPRNPAGGGAALREPAKPTTAAAAPTAISAPPQAGVGALAQRALDVAVPVYVSKRQTIETMPLEDYVRGVVAAEMPIDYEPEALKAQALAARTYIVRRIAEGDKSGVPVSGALVTDTVKHQAYLSDKELADRWSGDAYARNMDKLQRAVSDTMGLILTYEGKPINATFFSTSNGYTEDAGNVWQFSLPYLQSIPSPWDVRSPQYKDTVTFAYNDLIKKLGVKTIATSGSQASGIKVLKRTEGGRIGSISIGGRTFTGAEVREKLGLRSADFSYRWLNPEKGKGAQLELTTYGYGHGVGMSQWGANAMAQEGGTAEDIVRYYYKGVAISQASARAY